ncbi:hypothetical protein DVH05_022361 [Phytophthora capsici]|nr:hypothetical protein DVH05_022361 [Phytophthora capsici]
MDVTEQAVVIGAFQRLLSETEPDPDSGDESVEEAKTIVRAMTHSCLAIQLMWA